MAELNIMGYFPGTSTYHQMDVRFKLLSFVLVSITCLNARFSALAILSVAIIVLFLTARLPLHLILKDLRYFSILLFVLLLTRGLFTEGIPVVSFCALTISREGLTSGLLICWRLLVIVVLSIIGVATTKPSELKAGVQWFLAPIPYIPEKKAAVMLSLVIRFMPLLLMQARETSEAQKARCVENRKNPVYRFKVLVIPLLRRTFENADQLVTAMEARCYHENRTDPQLTATYKDVFLFGTMASICLLCFFTNPIF
jgi:energy-coupling factor transporter transmembrane protein EcfT